MPSVSRNVQDYLRLIPQTNVNGEGMISLARQNNKFNSFFIDGSNIVDPLGIAASGMAGGQFLITKPSRRFRFLNHPSEVTKRTAMGYSNVKRQTLY